MGLLCNHDEVVAMLKLSDRPPDPDEIERVCAAASEAIQTYAKRQFTPDEEASERTFTQWSMLEEGGWLLLTGDMHEIESVTVNGTALDAAAWAPYPLNPVAPGFPSTGILLATAPAAPVTVAGTWGWPAVPEDIHYAAIQQAAAWYTLDSSRLSDSWSNELGGTARPTPVARSLLYGVKDTVRPYRMVSMG